MNALAYILETAKTNSLTILKDLQPTNQKKSFQYVWELAEVLIRPHVTLRYQNPIGLEHPSFAAMNYVLNIETEAATDRSVVAFKPSKRKQCYLCLEEIRSVPGR